MEYVTTVCLGRYGEIVSGAMYGTPFNARGYHHRHRGVWLGRYVSRDYEGKGQYEGVRFRSLGTGSILSRVLRASARLDDGGVIVLRCVLGWLLTV